MSAEDTLTAEIAELWGQVAEGPVHPDLRTREDLADLRLVVYALTD